MNIEQLELAKTCIDHTGTVDFHRAIELSIPDVKLAEAKFMFFLDASDTDATACQDHLKRLITNSERADESKSCWAKEEVGTAKGRYYHYRYSYYLSLVQYHRNYLAGVLVDGFNARVKNI